MAEMKKKIRVGLDFDGVIAYNPLRIFRAIIVYLKQKFLGVYKIRFLYPEKKWQQVAWRILHNSSIFPGKGLNTISSMRDKGIEIYLITGRYSFLDDHLDKWLIKNKVKKYFKSININKNNEQPHLFKEKMINELKLD